MPSPSATSVQAVLFDFGQVLSAPPDPVAWAQIQAITGLDDATLHTVYWAHRLDYDRGTHTGNRYWKAVGQSCGQSFNETQIAALTQADTLLWTQPNQPMVDWVLRLHAAGTPTGILSNLGDDMSAGVMRTFPWLQRFHFRLWSHTLGLSKPDPAIYAAAIAGMAVEPAGILFIDDRAENIAGALAAGMQAIHYTDQAHFEQQLSAQGLSSLWSNGTVGS